MKRTLFILMCFILYIGQSQQTVITKKQMATTSLLKNISIKNIGPTIMSGRVVDIDVNPNNPIEFYVGYASGGIWYTNNNGTSFEPILDNSQTQNVGDIAVHWQSGTIWAGTGENNASRSSYSGVGILKSTNHGETWENMGLEDSHHIGRIIINPNNPNEVIVAATGHLYSSNNERGIYKTIDGGKTWNKNFFVNNDTGIIDVAYAPNNFQIQFATSWQKDRKAWHFESSGSGSSIYKSTNGGDSWNKIALPESGFPTGLSIGRIGLAIFDENTIYAIHDSQFRRKKRSETKTQSEELQKDNFKTMSVADFLKLDTKKLNAFLKTNGFQEKYRAENVKNLVRDGIAKPADIATYLENANSSMEDTPVIGAEVYRSDDGGIHWVKMNETYIDNFFYSFGYYFGQIRVNPSNKNHIYLAGVPLIKSEDGGKTFTSISKENVHADHHALWVNPQNPNHLINGNDGGLNISYDDGATWTKNNSPSVGQFYAINIDHQEPYNVYGGLQDNGVWKGKHNAKQDNQWQQTGHNPWTQIMGGDGMHIQIDKRNPNIVYTGFQFGNYYRINLEKNKRYAIQPKHELGEPAYRFNWQTPILLSEHNQDILYLGGNKLHRSLNQGEDWEAISDDLTQGGKQGNVAYGTLTSISESPFKFGLIYTGSDDGLVHITKDGGGSWEKISQNIPEIKNQSSLWVSRIIASKHKKERVYVTFNGYRWDNFTPYVFMSNNYGKTWENIAANIPTSPVNVIVEDPENENLLFVGTDNGLYASLNQGASWELFQNGMPNVAVHDLVIQPEAKHLLIGTHGRSIYKANISLLQKLTPETMQKNLHVFHLGTIRYSKNWGNPTSAWAKPNTPGLDVSFYTLKAGSFSASIQTMNGTEVSATTIDADKGINILSYDVAFSKTGKSNYLKKNKRKLTVAKDGKTYLPKGKYVVGISGNGSTEKVEFVIE